MKLFICFILQLLQFGVIFPLSQKGCVSDPADIVFLLDSSISIEPGDFNKELQFISEFAKHYVIGPNNVQIGIVVFSTSISLEINLNTYQNINDLERAIRNVLYSAGGTATGNALHYVMTNSFKPNAGDRPNVPNFLIVITDGYSNNHTYLASEAHLLHTTNIETFAIGVGSRVSISELRTIASSHNHTLQVGDHLNLHILLKEIQCATQPTTATQSTVLPTKWWAMGSGSCQDRQLFKCTKAVCSDPTLKAYCSLTCGTCTICKDSTIFNCNPAVCSTPDLKKYCPVTCGSCVPCKDSTIFNCNPAVCSTPDLKKYCPVTCGSCGNTG